MSVRQLQPQSDRDWGDASHSCEAQIVVLVGLLLFTSFQARADIAADPGYWQLPVARQGEPPAERLPLADRIDHEACGSCHPEQRRDWDASRHHLAASIGLLAQLDSFDLATRQSCLDCHAPREEQHMRWEEGRLATVGALHGVDCAACHLRGHVYFGPEHNDDTPHGTTQRHPLFKDVKFCIACHQFGDDAIKVNGKPLENTYVEWQSSVFSAAGVICQHCHMPEGRHLFRGIHDPEMTRSGLAVRAVRTQAGVSLSAGNLGAGHALPTYITPRIRLRITNARNGQWAEHLIQRQMTWNAETGWRELVDSRLMPGVWTQLTLEMPVRDRAVVEVVVEPDADYHDRVYPALLAALAGELTPRAAALLRRAHDEAGRSAYLLYRMTCGTWEDVDTRCPTAFPIR